MRAVVFFVLALCVPLMAVADDAPSVLVKMQSVQQGSLPQIITAYGTVEPLPDGATTISLQRAGQISALSVSAGQKVKQGDALLSFASDPAAQLGYGQAMTTLDAAQKEQARIMQLLAQHLATQSQLTQANKAVTDAAAALEVEKKQGSDLSNETVSAPFDGTVVNVSVNSGDRVQANAPLLQIAHGSGLAVGLGVPLDDLVHIQTGQPVHLVALDSDRPVPDGAVAFAANMLDPKTRLGKILVTIPAEAGTALISGEQFKAMIEATKFSGIIVPRSAVLRDDQGAYIFQVKDTKAVRVDVKLIGESGDSYVVAGALNEKAPIIVTGNYEVKNGDAVRETP